MRHPPSCLLKSGFAVSAGWNGCWRLETVDKDDRTSSRIAGIRMVHLLGFMILMTDLGCAWEALILDVNN